MGVGGRRKTFFHEKKSFSPPPEPLSSFQKKRRICKGNYFLYRWIFLLSGSVCQVPPLFEKSGVFVKGFFPFAEKMPAVFLRYCGRFCVFLTDYTITTLR